MTEQPPVPPADDEGGSLPPGAPPVTGSRVEPIDLLDVVNHGESLSVVFRHAHAVS